MKSFSSVFGHASDNSVKVVTPTRTIKRVKTQNVERAAMRAVGKSMRLGNLNSDWEYLETVWRHTFLNPSEVKTQNYAVLLPECPMSPRCPGQFIYRTSSSTYIGVKRRLLREIVSDSFKSAPAMINANAMVFKVADAKGCTTGIAVNSGDRMTHIVPVLEGYTIPHAMSFTEILLEPAIADKKGVGIHNRV